MIILGILAGVLMALYMIKGLTYFRPVYANRERNCCWQPHNCDSSDGHWVPATIAVCTWPALLLMYPEYRSQHFDRDVLRMEREVAHERSRLERDRKFAQHRRELEQIARERKQLEDEESHRAKIA